MRLDDDVTRRQRVLYFAYGSCMNQASLSTSLECDVSRYFVGPAQLDGYRLTFNYPSMTAPTCCANIEPGTRLRVEGAMYEVPQELLERLDHREGVGSGRYARCTVEVLSTRAVAIALCYRGIVTLPYEAAPSDRYREILTQGLVDACVSEPYRLRTIAHMASLPTRDLPGEVRNDASVNGAPK